MGKRQELIERALDIFALVEAGTSRKDICEKFGITSGQLSEAILGNRTFSSMAIKEWVASGRKPPAYFGWDDLNDYSAEDRAMIVQARHQGKDLKGYVACATGRVGKIKEGRYVRWRKTNVSRTQPYPIVKIPSERESKSRTLHSIIAESFLGERPEGFDVCHANHDKTDARAFNLYYATTKHNVGESRKAGHMNGDRLSYSEETVIELFVLVRGEKMTIADAAEKLGMNLTTARCILSGGMRKNVKEAWDDLAAENGLN